MFIRFLYGSYTKTLHDERTTDHGGITDVNGATTVRNGANMTQGGNARAPTTVSGLTVVM